MSDPDRLEEVRQRRPALSWLLAEDQNGHNPDGTPWECPYCPFATVNPEREPPNPDDPGEGWYNCALLPRIAVWGESPACTAEDWRGRARRELIGEVERLRREQGSVAGYRTADGRIHDPRDVEIIRF